MLILFRNPRREVVIFRGWMLRVVVSEVEGCHGLRGFTGLSKLRERGNPLGIDLPTRCTLIQWGFSVVI